MFVYLLRYGILDWSTYLKEVKHFALDKSSGPTSMSMRAFRAPCCAADVEIVATVAITGVFFMTLVTIATIVYRMNPAGNPTVDMDLYDCYRLPDLTAR